MATTGTHRRSIRARGVLNTVLTYSVLIVITIVTVYPLVWLASGSVKTEEEFYSNTWAIPRSPQWSNYPEAWSQANLGQAFLNSIVVTGVSLAILLTCGPMAAYAFAKAEFPGKKVLFWYFMFGLMVPSAVILIPSFSVMRDFGLIDTKLSLILVYSANNLAFCIFMLRAFFFSIPTELEDAALIDGCTRFGTFWRIILPLSRPGLATVLIWSGLNIWNEFFVAGLFVRTAPNRTWPVAITKFVFMRTTQWPHMFAALVIATVPTIVVYILGQKQFIRGLTAGAVKG